jgi:hypothetical protein
MYLRTLLTLLVTSLLLISGGFIGLFGLVNLIVALITASGDWKFGAGLSVFTVFGIFGLHFLVNDVAIDLLSHTEVERRGDRLYASVRAGWFLFYRFVPMDRIFRFQVVLVPKAPIRNPVVGETFAQNGLLAVELVGGPKIHLVYGYPLSWITALADSLAYSCATTASNAKLQKGANAIEVTEAYFPNGYQDCDVAEQPEDSQAVLVRHADGITLTMPPKGIWSKRNKLRWTVIVGGTFILRVIALLYLEPPRNANEILKTSLTFLLSVAVGVLFILGGVYEGRRHAAFAVIGDRLLAFQFYLFGNKRWEWSRAQLICIRTVSLSPGPRGSPCLLDCIIKLEIHSRIDPIAVFLSERNGEELRWIATVLRQALRVPSEPEA